MRSIKALAAALLLLGGSGTVAQSVDTSAPAAQATSVARTATPPVTARPMTKQDLDAWLDGYVPFALKRGDIAGAVVVVVKDGKVLTQRGFGYADVAKRTPVDPATTMFRNGSVSKLVTWTAVMQQVEAGRIDLDADVNAYLDFKIPPKDGKPVTMRELMTHTAGFEEHAKYVMFDDPKSFISLGQFVKTQLPRRIYTPGTTPAYSNYGATLAGYIVERVSKTPFNEYIERHVFAPLGMAHSTFRQPLPGALAPFMASGYKLASGKAGKFEFLPTAPAGGLSASGVDMAQFMIAHLDQGAGLMKPETARMMHDTPLTMLPPLNRMELGFFESNINGRQVIGHLGDTVQFHTALHLFMNEKVGLFASFNSWGKDTAVSPTRQQLFEEFADRYFPAIGPADGRVDAKTSTEHAKLLAGRWIKSRRAETTLFSLTNLMGQVVISVDDKGNPVVPVARDPSGAPMKWVEIAPFVWRNVNGHERLAAKVVGGKVVRWSIDSAAPFMVFDRVSFGSSAGWITPALIASLAILLLTVLQWPIAALIRRHYRLHFGLKHHSSPTYRSVRGFAGLTFAFAIGWLICLSVLKTVDAFDPWLWLLQIGGLLALIGGVLLAVWNVRLAFSQRLGWFSQAWNVLILLALLMLAYTAWTFGLLSMSVHY
ncbi:MAG: serine hydrolase [Candidatus Sphingomonas colombiensis]|nr:serine hydrolase domain-containing protein [Sphingomonas sp.]WEK42903.1 MAG: serine hydrolase [Sphingomonas sp.]